MYTVQISFVSQKNVIKSISVKKKNNKKVMIHYIFLRMIALVMSYFCKTITNKDNELHFRKKNR